MALILNIETATETCSVALANNCAVLAYRESNEPKVHGASLTLFIDDVIKKAGVSYNDLDAIAISRGPGSYTGLRIGVSVAKGLCFALDKPLLSVNTLLAFSSYFKSHYERFSDTDIDQPVLYCPMLDARRMEVYTAVFDKELNFIEPTQALVLHEHIFDGLLKNNRMVFFGNGATKLEQIVHTSSNGAFVAGCEASAKGMIRWSEELYKSGIFEDVAYFEPYYLKNFITTQSKKK